MKTTKAMTVNDNELIMKDLQNTHKMCEMLMSTPHYRSIGSAGIFAIVEKSKSIGVNTMDALNGGMYFVQGKVELSSAMMNQLIRTAGHSITKDKKSDETICILHGKRNDNGDTWVESFSIKDAQQAGIYKNQWLKYPKDMLFARALSRLARQLFPDVIKGCYVQGEIGDAPAFNANVTHQNEEYESADVVVCDTISEVEAESLQELIGDDEAYRKCVLNFIKKQLGVDSFLGMTRTIYEKILPVATRKSEERKEKALELVYGEKNQMEMAS